MALPITERIAELRKEIAEIQSANRLASTSLLPYQDLEAMKQMLGANAEALKNIKPGQKVQQIQVSFIKDDVAVNLTASFPAEQFEIYARPFQKFLSTIKST